MPDRKLRRNTIIGLGISLALAAGKVAAGLLGHSSALVADAVESMADALGSVIVWWGLAVAERGPDEAHPYGYGRAEAVAALGVGALLIVAAVGIVVKAGAAMLAPHQAPAAWTLGVLVAVVVVKEALFRLVLRGADVSGSDAARADAWHHRADAATSAAAFIGVAVAVWGPGLCAAPRLVLADEAAAIFAAVVVLFTGLRMAGPALRELLDAANPAIAGRVRAAAGRVEGVRRVETVHARKSGRGYLVDLHLHVDPHLSVRDGHALAGRVKAGIRGELPAVRHVLIHVEPHEADRAA